MEYSDDTNSTSIHLNDRQQQHPANSNNMISNVSGNSNNIFDTSSTNTNSQQSMMMGSSRMSQSYGGLDNSSSSFLLRQGILPPSTSQLHR